MSYEKELIKNIPVIGLLAKQFILYRSYLAMKKVLSRNSRFKNKYLGKRCFIIGNGPSLREQDVRPLKNEFTFTVNSMIAAKEYDDIEPDVHVMVDSTRFDKANKVFNKSLKDLMKKKHIPVCIFPAKFKQFFVEEGYEKKLDIIYVHSNSKNGRINEIDFTKLLPAYPNVINLALFAAIYMGFSEIYLVGVDMTGFVKVYDENNEISYGGHFYENQVKEEKEILYKLHLDRQNENMLKAYGIVFEVFRHTREYANEKGVKIYNATKGGTLDVFPRVRYENLINNLSI